MATKHLIICALVFLVGFAGQCFAQEPMDGGIVMYRQFTNGSLDTDLNIFLDFSSIGIANVWNPAIIREIRSNASDIEGSTAIHYDPCVYPVPIWNGNTTDFGQFSTLNTKASGDGQLTWIFAGFYTFYIGQIRDNQTMKYLCPRNTLFNCSRYFVIDLEEPQDLFEFSLTTAFDSTVIISGGPGSCPTSYELGKGVHETKQLVANEKTMFSLESTNILRFWLQISAPPSTNSTLIAQFHESSSLVPASANRSLVLNGCVMLLLSVSLLFLV